MGCLYRLTSPSGKSYIGITNFVAEKRFSEHVRESSSKSNRAILNAIRKYGPDFFTVETLVIANDSDYLKMIEVRAISSLKTHTPHGYNMTAGGDGVLDLDSEAWQTMLIKRGKTVKTKANRKKNSDRQKLLWTKKKRKERSEIVSKLWEDEDYREHMSEVHKGWHVSNAEKEKMSKRSKEYFSNPENKKRHSDVLRGLWQDPEFRQKRADSFTDEVKDKIGQASVKMWEKEGFRKKKKESLKKYFDKPGVRESIADKTREQMADPEVRKKIGEAMCKYRGCTFIKIKKPTAINSTFNKIWDSIYDGIEFGDLYRMGIQSRRITDAVDRGYLEISK